MPIYCEYRSIQVFDLVHMMTNTLVYLLIFNRIVCILFLSVYIRVTIVFILSLIFQFDVQIALKFSILLYLTLLLYVYRVRNLVSLNWNRIMIGSYSVKSILLQIVFILIHLFLLIVISLYVWLHFNILILDNNFLVCICKVIACLLFNDDNNFFLIHGTFLLLTYDGERLSS